MSQDNVNRGCKPEPPKFPSWAGSQYWCGLTPNCGLSYRPGCTRVYGQALGLSVAACNRNGLDLQSSHFSTGINCVYPSQQTEIICE
ncbi:hypothetical protein F4W70_28405 [Pseudomonas cannabina]|nr:hypothetical protein F4W70_28405 [Pseudomonas cannabina]